MAQLSQDHKLRLPSELNNLAKLDDNKWCAECGAASPRWTSFNLGIFICLRCAGLHRSLGTHVSKVKSITLDSWTVEQVEFMKKKGNKVAKSYFEASLPESYLRPQDDRSLLTFLKKKYEYRSYVTSRTPYETFTSRAKEFIDAVPVLEKSKISLVNSTSNSTNLLLGDVSNNLIDKKISNNDFEELFSIPNNVAQNPQIISSVSYETNVTDTIKPINLFDSSQLIPEQTFNQTKSMTTDEILSFYNQPKQQQLYYGNQYGCYTNGANYGYSNSHVNQSNQLTIPSYSQAQPTSYNSNFQGYSAATQGLTNLRSPQPYSPNFQNPNRSLL